MNLATRILDRLSSDPSKKALTLLAPSGTPTHTYTRSDLLTRAAAWATPLRMSGLIPGTPVALALARDIDLAAVHIATLAAGTPIVPINTALADTELDKLLKAARPGLVIADAEFASAHRDTAAASNCSWWLTADSPLSAGETFSVPDLSQPGALTACPTHDDAAALILFTSGTTGQAKSVPLSHANLGCNLAALADAWSRSERDRLLHMLPAHHFHGLVLGLYGSLDIGSEIALLPRFDARAALDAIQRERCDLLMGVPTMYARMIDAAGPNDDLGGVRLALSGSAPLAAKTWQAFHERFGIELVERYGLTETGIVSTNTPGSVQPGSVGRALSGTELAIHNAGAYHQSAGERGEICVRSPSVTAGYGNDASANAESFRDGWFHTGDLGRLDEDGTIWIDGRLKELIIVGGSNVIPGEVERALDGVDGIVELAVNGLSDADLGEVVAAFVVAEDQASEATRRLEDELRAAADDALAGYKRPRHYIFLQALPRNAMGKIDRRALTSLGS